MLAAAAERLRRSHTIFLLLVKTEPIVPCGLCSYSASPSSVGVSQDQNRGLLPHAPPPHLFLRNATLNGDYNHTYPAKSYLYPTYPIPHHFCYLSFSVGLLRRWRNVTANSTPNLQVVCHHHRRRCHVTIITHHGCSFT